jgi:hypothetical protein
MILDILFRSHPLVKVESLLWQTKRTDKTVDSKKATNGFRIRPSKSNLSLFTALLKVLEATESDARQLDRSREILDKTNQLGENIYVMSNSGAHFVVQHNKRSLNETLTAADNAEKTLAWLDKELHGLKDSLPALPRVKYEMSTALKIARELLSVVSHDSGQENFVVDLQVARLRTLVESLNNNIIAMTDQERKLIEDTNRTSSGSVSTFYGRH